MKSQKSSLPIFFVKVTSFWLAVGTIVLSPEVLAQSPPNHKPPTESGNPSGSSNPLSIDRYLRWAQLFEGDGQPGGTRRSGGSRGNCSINENLPPLTALIPERDLELPVEENTKSVFGKTVDGHPTFWFYVPYNASSEMYATFVLLDGEKPVLEKPLSISLSGTPGLVSITLPASATELEIDKDYRWFFELECDAENPSENPRVDGWVQRVAPIPGIEPDDYIAYADRGIWYNALTPLARMRQQDGQNATLQKDWEDLLKAVELESFIDVSVVDCCKDLENANGI
jgi:Domain of Unknown Function (DUF928)